MEQTNKKGIGVAMLFIFGLLLITIISGLITRPLLTQIVDFTTAIHVSSGVYGFFQLLLVVAFIFVGVNRKWYSNGIGQASAFVLAALFTYYSLSSILSIFSINIGFGIDTSIPMFALACFERLLLLAAWIGLLITLKIGKVVKIISLIYAGYNFCMSIILRSILFTMDFNTYSSNTIITTVDGIWTLFGIIFLSLILLFTILWMCKKEDTPAIQQQ